MKGPISGASAVPSQSQGGGAGCAPLLMWRARQRCAAGAQARRRGTWPPVQARCVAASGPPAAVQGGQRAWAVVQAVVQAVVHAVVQALVQAVVHAVVQALVQAVVHAGVQAQVQAQVQGGPAGHARTGWMQKLVSPSCIGHLCSALTLRAGFINLTKELQALSPRGTELPIDHVPIITWSLLSCYKHNAAVHVAAKHFGGGSLDHGLYDVLGALDDAPDDASTLSSSALAAGYMYRLCSMKSASQQRTGPM